MKVQIKKNLIIFEKPQEWEQVSERLVKEYGPSILISWKTRRELGFSVRHHQGLRPWEYEDTAFDNESGRGRYYYAPEVHLDFYNEAQQSFFVLKYINS